MGRRDGIWISHRFVLSLWAFTNANNAKTMVQKTFALPDINGHFFFTWQQFISVDSSCFWSGNDGAGKYLVIGDSLHILLLFLCYREGFEHHFRQRRRQKQQKQNFQCK